MPISRDGTLVFVHIPKTGGTSINRMFGLSSRRDVICTRNRHICPTKSPQHLTWLELTQVLAVDVAANAFKFAFVRNPWDRFLSEFVYRQRLYLSRVKADGGAFHGRCYLNVEHMSSLDAFVRVFEMPAEQRMHRLYGLDGHIETQFSFISDASGRSAMDTIGRFEQFDLDIRSIAQHAGYSLKYLEHLNRTTRLRDYRSYYSPFSRSAVGEFYKEDIASFGYSF